MPRIPTITTQVAARSARSMSGIPSPSASPEAFGAASGRGLQAFGGGLNDVSQGLEVYANKKREEDVANRIAQSDFTARELELRNEVGADGSGYQEKTLAEYDAFVEEEAAKIEDDATRTEYRRRMLGQRPSVSSRSATYEYGTAAEYADQQINTSLVGLDNRIRLQPDQFEELLAQGSDVIGASTRIPEVAKEGAKAGWVQKATRSYFEGRLESADDVYDIEAVLTDLKSEEWSSRLSGEGLESVLRMANAGKSAIATKADADARAAIEFLEGRNTDITTPIPVEELAAAQAVVEKSGNPITQSRMARIARDQDILRETRKMSPDQQRAAIAADGSSAVVAGLPPRLSAATTDAAARFGVSVSYLAGMASKEYGVFLKGDPDAIDYGQGNIGNNSSAVGVGQFVKGTQLAVAANPGVQAIVKEALGLDLATMSEDEILELRKNPEAAMLFSAAYASMNAASLRRVLGREPTDGELYIAHFMGGGGATQLITAMKADPSAVAAYKFPESAAANKSIFYKDDGTARTVTEVYGVLGSKFSGNATYVAAGDAKTRSDVLSKTEAGLKEDPMRFAASVGNTTLSDITSLEGFAQRGKEARSVADYYSIPYSDMKPFTTEEASQIGKQMADGTSEDVLAVLAQVQSMGGAMAAAGMKQISDLDPVYGFAGALAAEGGQSATASEVVRGQKRIEENPDVMKSIGASESDLASAFMSATGNALFDIAPKERQAISDAALAHYVETYVARGGAGSFDADAFSASVNAVLGADRGGAVIDTVNGEPTVLPPGVDGDLMESALQSMTVADWVSMSEHRMPPRYTNGDIADPQDLANEATLRTIGGGKYRVMMDDGTFLITGQPSGGGRVEAYIFTPTADSLEGVLVRQEEVLVRQEELAASIASEVSQAALPSGATTAEGVDAQRQMIEAFQADETLTTEEIEALTNKYGMSWAYDAEGNRIVE